MCVCVCVRACVCEYYVLILQSPSGNNVPQSKYAELLAIIEELGKEIRPTYAGSKSAMERLKRGLSSLISQLKLKIILRLVLK